MTWNKSHVGIKSLWVTHEFDSWRLGAVGNADPKTWICQITVSQVSHGLLEWVTQKGHDSWTGLESAKQQVVPHCTPAPDLSPGDLVMLSCQNIKTTCPSEKFDFRKIDPFKILDTIGTNAYWLDLPPSLSCLHPVFNISLLEPYHVPTSFLNWLQPHTSLPETVLKDSDHLQFREILDVQKIRCRFNYFLDFIHNPPTEQVWIPLSEIPHSYNEVIECFHHHHTKLPKLSTYSLSHKTCPSILTISPTIPSFSAPSETMHDPLALPPHPISPVNSDHFSYQPPSITTMWSKQKSRPHNMHHITELITTNHPDQSAL